MWKCLAERRFYVNFVSKCFLDMNEEEKELEKSVALRLSIERMVGKKIRSAQDFVWLS